MWINEELVEQLPNAREAVIIDGRDFVRMLVSKMIQQFPFIAQDRHDLEQSGIIGLIKAVDAWEPRRHTQFNYFASKCINNELFGYLRAHKRWLRNAAASASADRVCGDDPGSGFNCLSELETRVLKMRFEHGYFPSEIATLLSIPKSKVYALEKTAIAKLSKSLDLEVPVRAKGFTYLREMVDGFSADELASKYSTSTASIYDAIKYVAGFNLGRYIDLEMSPKEIAARENIDVETVLQLLDL